METKDKYLWLEEDTKKTHDWVNSEMRNTNKYFSDTDKTKASIRKRLGKLLNTDTTFLPTQRGDIYFFRMRKAGEDQSSIYMRKGLSAKPKLLINPGKLKFGAVHDWSVSRDGKFLSINFSKMSNDKCIIKIFDVSKNKFIKDTIPSDHYPYFDAWDKNLTGFWYVRGKDNLPAGEEKYHKRIYFHKFGTPLESDTLFFGEDLGKDDWPVFRKSKDGRFETVTVNHSRETTSIFFRDTNIPGSKFENITGSIKGHSYPGVQEDYIYMGTDYKAPNKKILRRKILNGKLGKWETFVPESKHKLEGWTLLKDGLFLDYIENVSSKIYLADLKTGKKKPISLPGLGSVDGTSYEYGRDEMFFSFSALDIPPSSYKLNLRTLKQTLYWKLDIPLDPSSLSVKQEWVRSKDKTEVPIFILSQKNIKRPGPTLVYAYGGFGISLMPHFWATVIPFIEDGGTFVMANIRGGGEFGEKWHNAAIKNKRHKAFEDFEFVLKHLTKKGYADPENLAIWGGSNGGLLTSVIMQKHPELFKAAVIAVPVTDMLRYHLFHGGRWWIHEYGDPGNNKMKKYLLSYSPYHNVKKINYPSAMVITSDHDDRVHPMHSFKFVAKLRENKDQKNPIILNVEKKAGHSGANKISAMINKSTDLFTFVYKELGMK